jgi:hypothetical protein
MKLDRRSFLGALVGVLALRKLPAAAPGLERWSYSVRPGDIYVDPALEGADFTAQMYYGNSEPDDLDVIAVKDGKIIDRPIRVRRVTAEPQHWIPVQVASETRYLPAW